MDSTTVFVIFLLAIVLAISATPTSAHLSPCSEPFFLFITTEKNLTHCKRLTTLGAEFGWSINRNVNNDHRIDMIMGARLHSDSGWLAWGVNPDETAHMVGTRAIIGIRHGNGSSFFNTYNITGDTKLGCKLVPTMFSISGGNEVEFLNLSMDYFRDLSYYTIQGSVVLPASAYNISELNHVWQVGYELEGTNPKSHAKVLQNVDSAETISLITGRPSRHAGRRRQRLRTVHGILDIVGWGVFLPTGVIIARYFPYPLQIFSKWYLRLHLSCQIIGYSVGTIGWIIGLCLGSTSKFYIFRTHRLYAMFIFAFTTLQILALRLRPADTDEYRKYWNMYHHFLGYGLLAVISINIFHGIGIVKPDETWKRLYTGILLAFGAIAATLEISAWIKFRKQINTSKPTPGEKKGGATATSSTSQGPPDTISRMQQ